MMSLCLRSAGKQYASGRMEDILKAVQSVNRQSVKPLEIIIAVDHNEKLKDLLLDMEIVRVAYNNKIVGGAETRNAGIYAAVGDIVAFLDDDAYASKDWLKHIMSVYDDESVLAVGGKTICEWENGRPSWFPRELDWLVGGTWKGHREDYGEIRNLIGPNMSFRRTVCNKIGYMRSELGALGTGFRAGDETEFYIRLKSAYPDAKIIYNPKAVVFHKVYAFKGTWMSLASRSYSLGYFKSKAAKVLMTSTNKPFHVEGAFLRYLLLSAIPRKLTGLALGQACAIIISILFTGSGYLKGKFERAS